MKIFGSDLDNTIINYSGAFDRGAKELGIELPRGTSGKAQIKQELNRDARWKEWVALQAKVYGELLLEAPPFPGAAECLKWLSERGVQTHIVSHRSEQAYGNEKVNLREAAREWVEQFCGHYDINLAGVHFEDSTEHKVTRLAALGCDLFVDDLDEVLKHEQFPALTRGLHFCPEGSEPKENESALESVRSWSELKEVIS